MDYHLTTARCESTPIAFLELGRESFKKAINLFVRFYYKTAANDFKIDYDGVDRISTRIHPRLNYYLFFHDKQLSQSRQAGLKAYWVLRYRPIKLISLCYWKKAYDINVYFAFFVILSDIIGECLSDCDIDVQRLVVNKLLEDYENSFIRSLSEYDISKESMILIADNIKKLCLCEAKSHGR
jgi:hypothetical protein